jgi:hypothetical protein
MDHTNPHGLHQTNSNHPIPYHLLKSRSKTTCNRKHGYHDNCTLSKGSALYPRVVISSLAKQLENLLFVILTLPLVYVPEITTCHYKDLLQELVMLCYGSPVTRVPSSSAKVSSWLEPLLHFVDQITSCVFLHTAEQDSQPIASLISKQAVLYRTHGGIYCPVVSTPKTWSLANSSMTNHTTWRNPTISTIPAHAQTTASILTTANSHHDGWKTVTPTFCKNAIFCANRSAYKNAYQIIVLVKNFPKIILHRMHCMAWHIIFF